MNIAILARVLFMSGVTTHIIDLTKQLNDKGHKVYIFTAGPEHPDNKANIILEQRLKDAGGKIISIDFPIDKSNKIAYVLKLILSLPKVLKQLKIYNVDVIHVHTPVLSFIPYFLKKKFVKTIHIKNLSLSIFDKKATHEITISRETFNEAKEKYHYSDDEITLIFNGVDRKFSKIVENKNILKKKYEIDKDKIIIGIVGSIQHRKGHDILLKAIGILPLILREELQLIILGEGENQNDELWLEKLIKEEQLDKIVKKFPFQDPKPFYDIMDIFVLPSRLEGFPLVVLEAFLSRCCVVRSNVEGAYDQITDGQTGFLFENENVEQLSKILENLITNKKIRDEVAIKGRQYALENFTSDIMAEKTLNVYQKVIKLK